MIRQIDNIQGTFLKSGRQFVLGDPYDYLVSPCLHLSVPKGFVTDFASIPTFFTRLFPVLDSHLPAAVLHDWLYSTGLYPRAEADRIFLQHMDRLGVPFWKRRAIYHAVRMGGWAAWNEHRRRDKEK